MIDSVPLIQNANDAQQINASIIAMKKASRELDEKIAQFNKLLSQEITNREKAITEAINSLDVASVGGSGKYISAISETDGKISATASDITSTVSSGNSQPVTSGGVADAISSAMPTYPIAVDKGGTGVNTQLKINKAIIAELTEGTADVTDGTMFVSSNATDNGFAETGDYGPNKPYKRKFITVWNYIKNKISNWMDTVVTTGSSNPITSGAVYDALENKMNYFPVSDLSDCNSALDGIYCSRNVANTPSNNTGFVFVFTFSYNKDNSYKVQFCMLINNNNIYVRNKVAGTWTAWAKKSV